jgi:hypothetical protein
MSYTQFIGTATLTVDESFDLDSFLKSLSDLCIQEENFIYEEYGAVNGEIDLHFTKFVSRSGNEIEIDVDTEEYNSNSEVWDWLIDQFAPIMTSDLMQIKSSLICSRNGTESCVAYVTKDKQQISQDDLIQNYLKDVSTLDVIQRILDTYDKAEMSESDHENALWAIAMIKHEMKNRKE